MKGFLLGLFRAAIISCFIFLVAFLNTGCSQGRLTIGGPTPTPTPGNAFVYTANAGGNNISGFANDPTGALTPVPGSPVASAGQPFGIAATPNGKFLYVSSFQNAVVTGFSITPTTGSLAALVCPVASTGAQPLKIAINPAGTLLYTSNQVGSVTGFSIDSTTGCLTAISTTATDTVARGLTIERTGQFLYVVTGGGGIDLFSIGATGTLTRLAIGGFDTGSGTMLAVKASPSTDVMIATDGGTTNSLRTFTINTSTGALTPVATVLGFTPSSPSAIAYNSILNASSPPFYIANTGSNTITTNSIATNATIAPSSPQVPDATGPVDLAVDPTGRFLYVANNGSSNVNAFNANITASNVNSVFISSAATGSGPESIVVVGHP